MKEELKNTVEEVKEEATKVVETIDPKKITLQKGAIIGGTAVATTAAVLITSKVIIPKAKKLGAKVASKFKKEASTEEEQQCLDEE